MKLICKGSLIAALLFAAQMPVQADPAKAEDDCYNMAVYYTARGFAMAPTNTSGLGGAGFTVSKGVDYVILVGRDVAARDLDLYVYDEVGSLILDDRRTTSRAGVKFRSSYSGTVQAYVHIARATGLAAYAVLVGRRGDEKGALPIPTGPTDFGSAAEATPR